MNNEDFNITPISKDVWKGRVDSENDASQFRLHQVVDLATKIDECKSDHVAIVGFASDVGVRRNKGRTGAVQGPDYFRSAIGSLCYHGDKSVFYDLGNIKVEDENLEDAQQQLALVIGELLGKNVRPFVVGGGHETAFGHFAGILNHLNNTRSHFKLGILNIDAHLDMRSYEEGAQSGSWALQAFDLAEEQKVALGYHAYGLNSDNNTRFLLDVARSKGASWSTNEEVLNTEKDQLKRVSDFLSNHTHIYCTVCLDVFDASIAPGVSAPAWNGIEVQSALNVIDLVKNSGKLMSLDVCELNPKFDQEQQTARVAGSIFNKYLR